MPPRVPRDVCENRRFRGGDVMVATSAYLRNACTFSQAYSLATALVVDQTRRADEKRSKTKIKTQKRLDLYRGSLRKLKPRCGAREEGDGSLLKKVGK